MLRTTISFAAGRRAGSLRIWLATLTFAAACNDASGPAADPKAASFDLVFERRPAVGDGTIQRLSLAHGATSALPLVVTVPGTFVRDATPSPDGSRIAFTVAWYPEGQSTLDGDIYVANIDGTGLRRLTSAEELDDQPTWSPDGLRIAFRSLRSGQWDIWTMNADGSGQSNLMTDVLPAASTEQSPAWSPDGSRIAFASDIDDFGHAQLWTMRADGTDKRRVLPRDPAGRDIDRDPTWSPDGSRLAFTRVTQGVGADIVVADLVTGVAIRLAMAGAQGQAAWSPDGARIAFTSNHEAPFSHIYTTSPDGAQLQRLTSGNDEYLRPRWLRVP